MYNTIQLHNNKLGADAVGRPSRTFKQLCVPGWEQGWDEDKVLLETKEFLKLAKHLYGIEVPRRTLQLYSSPQFKLLSPPIHKGGHISYYLHPEHTQRLAVVLHLRDKLRLSLRAIHQVLKDYPAEHYHLILNGVLTGDELLDFPALITEGFNLRDVVFYKVAGLLAAMDKGYWDLVGKEGRQAPRPVEKSVHRDLFRELKNLEGWLRTECRMEMGDRIQEERQRRHFESGSGS